VSQTTGDFTALEARELAPPPRSFAALKKQAEACHGCDLWRHATQTVMGEGPVPAQVMLVGEQPGDREDIAGRPFVGPAGRLLDEAMAAAGLDRQTVFVTNAVKHFKYLPRGKRRMHQRPNAGEIRICRWWLQQEFKFVGPRLVVALGRSAAQSLLGRAVTIASVRGKFVDLAQGAELLVTVHPSSLLRAPDEREKQRNLDLFVADLKKVARRAQAFA
jgi:DNA polymerase